jgi:hypothetical protein
VRDGRGGEASTLCLTGTCSVTGLTCFTDQSCGGQCSNDRALACTSDGECGAGTCSIGGASCSPAAPCTGAGNMCVFPSKCNFDKCTGNVCADPHLTIDYCTSVLSDLPLLGTGQVVGGGNG